MTFSTTHWPPMSLIMPSLCLTFFICFFGHFLFLILVCRVQPGRTLSNPLSLTPVPTPGQQRLSAHSLTHLETKWTAAKGCERITTSCLQNKLWNISHLSFVNRLNTNLSLTVWEQRDKQGTEVTTVPLTQLPHCRSPHLEVRHYLFFPTGKLITLAKTETKLKQSEWT